MAHLQTDIFRMSIPDQCRVMENGLTNAKGSDIAEYLSVFGFDTVRIDTGIFKVQTVKSLNARQQIEFGEQLTATAAFNEQKAIANKKLGATWKIAKMSITDHGVRKMLGIHRSKSSTNNGFIQQFDQFYRNITPAIVGILSEYGYSAEKLNSEKTLLDLVVAAHKIQDDETGEAQMATVHRDEAVDDLHEWMRKFYKVAKIALADEPSLLEKIGIIHRN